MTKKELDDKKVKEEQRKEEENPNNARVLERIKKEENK